MAATLWDIGHESRENVTLLTKSPNSPAAHPWNRGGGRVRGAQGPWDDVRGDPWRLVDALLYASNERDGIAI